MSYELDTWLALPPETEVNEEAREFTIPGFDPSLYMAVFRRKTKAPIWTPVYPFGKEAVDGSGLVSFGIIGNSYLTRKLQIASTANTFEVEAYKLGGFNYIYVESFEKDSEGNWIPINVPKDAIVDDLEAGFLRCIKDVQLVYPNYPVVGEFFEELDVATLAALKKLSARVDALNTKVDNLPGKVPRFYGSSATGNIYSAEFLNGVVGVLPNYLGRVTVMGHGTMNGSTSLRYGNSIQGNNNSVAMNGFSLDFARDSAIYDLHLSNGFLSLYGTVNRTYNGGSLNNVRIQGGGGQGINLYGTVVTCADGFETVAPNDGIGVTLYGTAANPNPVWPANAAPYPVTVIPYVAPVTTIRSPNGAAWRINNAGVVEPAV